MRVSWSFTLFMGRLMSSYGLSLVKQLLFNGITVDYGFWERAD
jgi:hypothetical protein